MYYNYFRPHTSLKDKTPAQAAGIKFPFRNWKDVVEQPYEVTANIPVNVERVGRAEPNKPRTAKRKKTVKRKREKPETSMATMRLK